jgi:hypothetical protein
LPENDPILLRLEGVDATFFVLELVLSMRFICVLFAGFDAVAFLFPFVFDTFDIDEVFGKEIVKVGWDCDRKLAHSSSTESICYLGVF